MSYSNTTIILYWGIADHLIKWRSVLKQYLNTAEDNSNKQVYLQLHRVGFTYTVDIQAYEILGNKLRRNVIRNVIHLSLVIKFLHI